MKRVLFLIAAAVTVAVTATPARATFTLTFTYVSGGAVDSIGNVIAPTQTTQNVILNQPPGNFFSGGIDLYDGQAGIGPDLILKYNIQDTPGPNNTSLGVTLTSLSVDFNNNGAGGTTPITFTITGSENALSAAVFPPATASTQLTFTASEFVTGGINSSFDPRISLTPNGGVGGTSAVVDPAQINTVPNPATLVSGSANFIRGTSSTYTLNVFGQFTLAGSENVSLRSGSFAITAPSPVPVPATALMGIATLPVLGLVRRFRRTGAAA